MEKASFTQSEFLSHWDEQGCKKYSIKQIIYDGDKIVKIELEDTRSGRKLCGKLATRLTKGEAFHWRRLHHRSLAPLLDIVTLHPKATIFITAYTEKTLREIVHDEKFYKNPFCFVRKKNYIEDVLWGMDYLHANSLCLMNISDCKVLIYEAPNKAVISDFSSLRNIAKATKRTFDVPPFYRAPELALPNSENFEPSAAEMWAVGVMALEVILQHMVPWALVDYNSSRVLEIVNGLDLGVLQAANSGSYLSMADLEEFKNFAVSFFRIDYKLRCSAKSAAASPFIQSSRNEMRLGAVSPLLSQQQPIRYEKNNVENFQQNSSLHVSDEISPGSGTMTPGNQLKVLEKSEIPKIGDMQGTESRHSLEESCFHTCGKIFKHTIQKDVGTFVKGGDSGDLCCSLDMCSSVDNAGNGSIFPKCSNAKIGHEGENLQSMLHEKSPKFINQREIIPTENCLDKGIKDSEKDKKAMMAKFLNLDLKNEKQYKNRKLYNSYVFQNVNFPKSKSLSLLSNSTWSYDSKPNSRNKINTDNEVQFLQRNVASLSPYNSNSNLFDLIPFVLSIKRRLEFIDAELLGKKFAIKNEISLESLKDEASKLQQKQIKEKLSSPSVTNNPSETRGMLHSTEKTLLDEVTQHDSLTTYEATPTDNHPSVKDHDSFLIKSSTEELKALKVDGNIKSEGKSECNDTEENRNSKCEVLVQENQETQQFHHKKRSMIDVGKKHDIIRKESIESCEHSCACNSNDGAEISYGCTESEVSNVVEGKKNIEISTLKNVQEAFYCKKQYSYKRTALEGDVLGERSLTKGETKNTREKELKPFRSRIMYHAGRFFQIEVKVGENILQNKDDKRLHTKKRNKAKQVSKPWSNGKSCNKSPPQLPVDPGNNISTLAKEHKRNKHSKQNIFNCLCIGN